MERNPVVRQLLGDGILIKNSPAYPSHLTHRSKISFPILETREILLDGVFSFVANNALAIGGYVIKIIFVKNHTAIFKSEPSRQLCKSWILCRRFLLVGHFR